MRQWASLSAGVESRQVGIKIMVDLVVFVLLTSIVSQGQPVFNAFFFHYKLLYGGKGKNY